MTCTTDFDQELSVDIGPSNNKEKRNFGQFMRKYFLEGQKLNNNQQQKQQSIQSFPTKKPSFMETYRNHIAFLAPFSFFQLGWWSLAIRYNLFERYAYRYQMPITMILGAFISGATSEGGGAVAFPVMTLLLKLEPTVARDFSLMIQSCGMAASGMTVLLMKIKLEYHSIFICSAGAFFSVILGVQFCDDLFSSQEKKMMFVSIWFSFGISLLILNLQQKRRVYDKIPQFCLWKGVVLFFTGLIGGFLTALTGSGVDICSFCVLTLLFRVSEKIATPTSVVLMWLNTWVGFYWRHLIMNGISTLAWEYFSVSAPVVVTMSPIGALIASVLHRQVLACLIYVLETLSVIGFLLTKPDIILVLVGVAIIFMGTVFFMSMSKLGQMLSDNIQSKQILLSSTYTPQQSTSSYSSPSHSSSASSNNQVEVVKENYVQFDC